MKVPILSWPLRRHAAQQARATAGKGAAGQPQASRPALRENVAF